MHTAITTHTHFKPKSIEDFEKLIKIINEKEKFVHFIIADEEDNHLLVVKDTNVKLSLILNKYGSLLSTPDNFLASSLRICKIFFLLVLARANKMNDSKAIDKQLRESNNNAKLQNSFATTK